MNILSNVIPAPLADLVEQMTSDAIHPVQFDYDLACIIAETRQRVAMEEYARLVAAWNGNGRVKSMSRSGQG